MGSVRHQHAKSGRFQVVVTGDRYEKPYGEWTEEDHEAERLNMEAYLALGQGRADIVTPLVALLRSSQPIHSIVREAVADALEGKDRYGIPIRLEVKGQNQGQLGGWAGKRKRFYRDLAIGEFVEKRRTDGDTFELAVIAAADHFIIGQDSCRRAISVHRQYETWLADDGPHFRKLFSCIVDDGKREEALKGLYFQTVLWRAPQSSS